MPSPAAAGRSHTTRTLAVVATAVLVYAALQALVVPALPTLQRDLHASGTSVSWVLTAYLLAAAIATPIFGRLGDAFGKERVLVWTLAITTFGTALAAVSNTVLLLDVARAIQGVGGGILPLGYGIVRDEFPKHKVAGAIGFLSSSLGIGGGAGILLAGVILAHLSWHWLFWIATIPFVIATLLTYRYVPESPVRTPAPISWIASLLMAVGISAILLAISKTTTWGWGSVKTIGLLTAGIAVCGAWIAFELRSDAPLVDMRLMRIRPVWTTNLTAALLGAGMYGSFVTITELVQEPKSTGYGLGASIIGSGLFLLPLTAVMLVVSSNAGRLAHRFGSKASLIAGTTLGTLSFVPLLTAHTHAWAFYVASGVLGGGLGLAFAALGALIVEAVPVTHTGVATGMNTVMRMVGGAVGTAISATFVATNLRHGQPDIHGYVLAFTLGAVFMLVALGSSLLVPTRTREAEGEALIGHLASAETVG